MTRTWTLAVGLAAAAAVAVPAPALAHGGGRDTAADYTPAKRFAPLASSTPCAEATADPFVLPRGYRQDVLVREGVGGTVDLFDMQTQNETGRNAGRYLYRTHETTTGSMVSVTDLRTGRTRVLAQRADWERFDGIVWTPWGTLLAAEETSEQTAKDPRVPEAVGGLVYEYFLDLRNPGRLRTDDPRDTDGTRDGVIARPALGAKSHEGMRFDARGLHYGISESSPGGIFRFIPAHSGDLFRGTLQALKTENGRTGAGTWVTIPDQEARVQAQTGATARGANGYNRPEDVETGQSTGRDRNNGGQTLYVALTGTDEVLAVDLTRRDRPFAYQYVGAESGNAASPEFDAPDNLALDRKGNLVITEDPGGEPPAKTQGDDVWVAAPPKGDDRHQPARRVARFASLKDCVAEPTGPYFALQGTERHTRRGPFAGRITGETLLINRQHSGQGTTQDENLAINPPRGKKHH